MPEFRSWPSEYARPLLLDVRRGCEQGHNSHEMRRTKACREAAEQDQVLPSLRKAAYSWRVIPTTQSERYAKTRTEAEDYRIVEVYKIDGRERVRRNPEKGRSGPARKGKSAAGESETHGEPAGAPPSQRGGRQEQIAIAFYNSRDAANDRFGS